MDKHYEKRICCFIDILGFKQHINETIKNEEEIVEKINAIKNILNEANDLVKSNNTDEYRLSKQVTQFSDSIVISFKAEEPTEILLTLERILQLCISAICCGFLLRGSISYDRLVHNSDYLFGPAINRAYEAETTAAIYPRIIMDETILELAKNNKENMHTHEDIEEYLHDILTKDFDGMYYIDYISKLNSQFDNPPENFKTYIEYIKNIILKNRNQQNDGIKIKYGWLKTKLNALIDVCKNNLIVIEVLETEGNFELARYYKELAFVD